MRLERLDTRAGEIVARWTPVGPAPEAALYLLHGRDGAAGDWDAAAELLADAVARGEVAPLLAVALEVPGSGRHWWRDSRFGGSAGIPAGRAVATAIAQDVVPEIERTAGLGLGPHDRLLAGVSMGGAGVIELAARFDIATRVIALAPAWYEGLPPADSTARMSGAFGVGDHVFDPDEYRAAHPALLWERSATPLQLWIAAGDAERPIQNPDGAADLDLQAARLHAWAKRSTRVTSSLRIVHGGHDHRTWDPALIAALAQLAPGPPVVE